MLRRLTAVFFKRATQPCEIVFFLICENQRNLRIKNRSADFADYADLFFDDFDGWFKLEFVTSRIVKRETTACGDVFMLIRKKATFCLNNN